MAPCKADIAFRAAFASGVASLRHFPEDKKRMDSSGAIPKDLLPVWAPERSFGDFEVFFPALVPSNTVLPIILTSGC